jgi:pyruvate dehydrogenase E1 component beta subunit
MKSAIRDDNPVLFFEHKALYRTRWPVTDEYKSEDFLIPFGQSVVRREGSDITVVATLVMVHYALEAARQLAKENISLEVIDPRTLVPLDKASIVGSVQKTGRLLVVDEAYITSGIQSEIIALASENNFGDLKAAPRRLGNPGVPVPFEPSLEDAVLPTTEKIIKAAGEMMVS